jgi:hypothetical protein
MDRFSVEPVAAGHAPQVERASLAGPLESGFHGIPDDTVSTR